MSGIFRNVCCQFVPCICTCEAFTEKTAAAVLMVLLLKKCCSDCPFYSLPFTSSILWFQQSTLKRNRRNTFGVFFSQILPLFVGLHQLSRHHHKEEARRLLQGESIFRLLWTCKRPLEMLWRCSGAVIVIGAAVRRPGENRCRRY